MSTKSRFFRKMLFLLGVLLIVIGGVAGLASTNTVANAQTGWTLVWSDEFNSGSAPNPADWTNEIGYIRNNELQYYTARPENVKIENGNLVITGRQESYMGYNYTSGGIITQGKHAFQYGRIEMRAKLPYGKGMWPCFWTMGEEGRPNPAYWWPATGEIDIMEMVGGTTGDSQIYGTIHWDPTETLSGHQSDGLMYQLPSGKFADAYHIIAVEWDANEIRWYMDSTLYHTAPITDPTMSEFHQPHYILIDLAIGGNWPGPPDGTTVFPQYYYLDYVRVYSNGATVTPLPPTATPAPVTVPYRIEAANSSDFTDGSGNVWKADNYYYVGGSTVDRGAIAIANTTDDRIYQTERWGSSGYTIPIANGSYTVKLHFAETASQITAAGQRVFNVNVEGQALNNLDVFAEVGKDAALIKTFNNVTVSDGYLNIGLTQGVENTEINGVEVLAAGGPTPTRTNTPVPPTATRTFTPVPPTATRTNTPVPPTATFTPVPPTATNTPVSGAYDDEFTSGTLAGKWSWVRQDAVNWSLTARSGYMRIIAQALDINGATNTAKNILLETAPTGDFTVIVKLDGKPTANYAQGGIIIYQDDDNYVKVVRLYWDGNMFQLARETGGVMASQQQATDSIGSTVSYLKVVKSGTSYTGFYSADGITYSQVGTAQTASLSNIKIGFVSMAGTGLNSDFDYIHVTTAGGPTPTNTPVPPTPTRTNTPVGPTPTRTNTPVPPTPTRTNTPVPGNTHGGTWAAKKYSTSGPTWNYLSQYVTVSTNTNYSASVWIKGTGTSELGVSAGYWGASLGTANCTASGSWTQCSISSFNSGSNTLVTFYMRDTGAAGTFYLDDAFLGGGSNLSANPGFESGDTGWAKDAAFTIVQP